MQLPLEPLVEEQNIGTVEGCHVDLFLTKGNLVAGLIDTMTMALEEGESEDVALPVNEERPKEEEVRNRVTIAT